MIANIKNVMIGTTQVDRVYLGGAVVWQNAIPLAHLPIGTKVCHVNGGNKYAFYVIAKNHPHFPTHSIQIVNDPHVMNGDNGSYSPGDFSPLYTPLYTSAFVELLMEQSLPVNAFLSPYYEDKQMMAHGKVVLADSNETFDTKMTYGGKPLAFLQNKPQARVGVKTLLRGGRRRYNDPTETFCDYTMENGKQGVFQYIHNRTTYVNYGVDIRGISSLPLGTMVKGIANSEGEYEIVV